MDWTAAEDRRMADYLGEGKDGPPMTEECYEGIHLHCDGRTIDGWPCQCACHEEGREEDCT